ncbi:uncharacterized protein LOC101853652 isoform X2 [Aplysia californica]|uniref:Uncharacterized protein LOC101853652 isoform X2 n=1 Tax=Aplysia californica TaxID=6500 RepID=A0ABM1W2M5_APLCA|nr:uncharacterized protein LOC101853652 isoform X2 [Aplysia californica]
MRARYEYTPIQLFRPPPRIRKELVVSKENTPLVKPPQTDTRSRGSRSVTVNCCRDSGYNSAGDRDTERTARNILLRRSGSPASVLGIFLVTLMMMQIVQVAPQGPPYPEPVFLPRLLNVTAREGGTALLPCAVHFLGTKEVTWKKLGGDHFLSVGAITWVKDPNLELSFNEITPEVTEWNLLIKRVAPEHAGTYECRISDKDKLYRYIKLNVIVSRPPIALSGKRYVEQGEPIHLFCNTTGPLGDHLSIDWFKDGDKIDYSTYKHIVITNYNVVETNSLFRRPNSSLLVSELLIDRSRASDTGTYICRSAQGYIANHKVTVLFADTTNVKRGNPSTGSGTSQLQCLDILIHVIIISVISLQISLIVSSS